MALELGPLAPRARPQEPIIVGNSALSGNETEQSKSPYILENSALLEVNENEQPKSTQSRCAKPKLRSWSTLGSLSLPDCDRYQ